MRILDRGTHNGRTFLVMPMLTGCTLASLRREGAIRPPEAPRIVTAIVAALGALHAAGLRHGDVRAENVFIGPDGEVTLLDMEDPVAIRPLDDDAALDALVRSLLAGG